MSFLGRTKHFEIFDFSTPHVQPWVHLTVMVKKKLYTSSENSFHQRVGKIFRVALSDYKTEKVNDMFKEWATLVKRMDHAYESEVFNASPNFACKSFCPVQQCAHWGK